MGTPELPYLHAPVSTDVMAASNSMLAMTMPESEARWLLAIEVRRKNAGHRLALNRTPQPHLVIQVFLPCFASELSLAPVSSPILGKAMTPTSNPTISRGPSTPTLGLVAPFDSTA
ncbi:hypothetical protein JX266_000729 [Neoarthrinium moseri]|nr:hypothetical protein JX266_000729 [Neoarthrinium moseri]